MLALKLKELSMAFNFFSVLLLCSTFLLGVIYLGVIVSFLLGVIYLGVIVPFSLFGVVALFFGDELSF